MCRCSALKAKKKTIREWPSIDISRASTPFRPVAFFPPIDDDDHALSVALPPSYPDKLTILTKEIVSRRDSSAFDASLQQQI